MDFRILGPLEVLDEGRAVTLGGSKQRALLALLLLHANETLSTDRLIDELWGEHPPASAEKAVQVRISRLRRALAGGNGQSAGVVVTRDRGYELTLDPERLDAHRFERLVAEARSELSAGRLERGATAFERAVSLWRGEPLVELAAEHLGQREIRRLADLHIAAMEELVETKLALGRHAEVVGKLEALIAEYPYREGLRGQLMLALYRSDRQAEALQAYQEARRTLVDGLGVEPGEPLRTLERAILAQDPELHLTVPEAGPSRGRTLNFPRADGNPLLEREQELDELRSAWEQALSGHGRLVVVEGAAGTGKSALLAAATEVASAAGLRVLGARGSELERGLGFGAVRQLFETVVTQAAPAEREKLLAGAAAPAEWVLAPDLQDDASRAGAQAGFAALHGIYWLASNLSVSTPLLLAVDDLHWVDGSSARALVYLARRISQMPIALVVALRPDEPGTPVQLLDELRAEPDAGRIGLRPLRSESAAAIVRASFPDADDPLCRACFDASAGNPFYLRELIRAIVVDGLDGDAAAAVRDASIPAVADRVGRRISRVGNEAVALARAMAVLDDGGRLADAAALAGLDEDAAASAASAMKRIEVLDREDPFAFVHPLVRRSVYDALSVTERDAAHRAAAVRLRAGGASAEAVAANLAAVRPEGSASVAAALREAANEAKARAAPEAAIGWLRRALDEDATEPLRALLLHELGQVELLSRDPAAIEHLRQAHELAAEPVLRARIALDRGEILFAAGQWEAGVAAVSDALDDLGDRDPELAVDLETLRAMARVFDPRLVAAFDRDRERLLGIAAGESWGARALSVLLASNAAARGEGVDQVRPLVEQGIRGGRLLAERGAGGWAASHAPIALLWIEEDDRALEVVEEIATEARRSGALIGGVTAMIIRSVMHVRRGELTAAEIDLRTALDTGMHREMPLILNGSLVFLNDLLLERPSLEDVAALVEATELDRAFLATTTGAMLLETRGRLRLARGERESAVADLRACAVTNRTLRFGPTYSPWRSALALALPSDARDEALALADEEVALAAATGLARPQGVAMRTAGVLRGGDDGLRCLRESIAMLEGSSARLEHARSLVELGAALRRRGQRAEAREPLAAGMELAHRCGAERLVAHSHEELRAAGARPRRFDRTGVEALTASEGRVVRLVAEGRSNSEVAQELFVSLKTVETHLSHAYAKLGLSGAGARRLLAAALGKTSDIG